MSPTAASGASGVPPDTASIYRRLATAHLMAAGFESPEAIIDGLYADEVPAPDAFAGEVASFESAYVEAMRVAVYCRTIEDLAGEDAAEFARLYKLGRNEQSRRQHGGKLYLSLVEEIPPYSPPSVQEYTGRFEDYPEDIHERVLRRAAKLAMERLSP